jgi:hypothetical protein
VLETELETLAKNMEAKHFLNLEKKKFMKARNQKWKLSRPVHACCPSTCMVYIKHDVP